MHICSPLSLFVIRSALFVRAKILLSKSFIFCLMDRKVVRRRKTLIRKSPYRLRKKASKPSETMSSDSVLEIHTDVESDLLRSSSESSLTSIVSEKVKNNGSTVDVAKSEMLALLVDIRNSQSNLCTKTDLQEYSLSINSRFEEVEQRVSANHSSITSLESRIKSVEAALASNNHDSEMVKQNALVRNVSILGIPPLENENLPYIAVKIFSLIGCTVARSDIIECYRVGRRNPRSNIFIVKLNDYGLKLQILKAKTSKDIRVCEVMDSSKVAPDIANQFVFINNHVTPHFGKLLAEGRKAVKDKKLQSVWMGRNGCSARLDSGGKEYGYRSTDELYKLISLNENALMSVGSRGAKRPLPDDPAFSPTFHQKSKK